MEAQGLEKWLEAWGLSSGLVSSIASSRSLEKVSERSCQSCSDIEETLRTLIHTWEVSAFFALPLKLRGAQRLSARVLPNFG